MKLFLYTTDIEAALKDDFAWSLTVSSRNDLNDIGGNDWHLISEIDIDVNINREQLTKQAISDIDNKITELKAATSLAITSLESRQQNLLALTNDGGS